MKITSTISLILALSVPGFAMAQSMGMDHSGMAGMHHGDTGNASPGMNMSEDSQNAAVHQAIAVVQSVNPVKGSVMLAHEAIPSLNLPAMTMGFVVKDSKLFDKLIVGKKVNIAIVKQGADYVITTVK